MILSLQFPKNDFDVVHLYLVNAFYFVEPFADIIR